MVLNLQFLVSINPLFPGEKIIQGDSRHALYHGAFQTETHTPESFLAAIEQGKSFCAELLVGDCGREHHGQNWCCAERRQKSDSTHCGRPDGYRVGWHFQSSQVLALDVDSGNLTIDDLLADPFISSYATFIYPTISWTLEIQKWRVVFILSETITDAQVFRKAATALLDRYQATDQQVKDPARLFFGMKPGNGDSVMLRNQLPMGEVLKLVSEFEDQRRKLDRESNARRLPSVDSGQITDNTRDERYVSRAIQEELAFLGSRPAGSGERYPNIVPTVIGLESLRLSDWLAPEARAKIDTTAMVLEGTAQNGSLALYGEPHLRKAIDWGIAHAEPRAMPANWPSQSQDRRADTDDPERAEIWVTRRHMRDITADAVDALVQANQPTRIFCRGTALVRLNLEEDGLAAEPLSNAALKGELDRAANFIKPKKGDDGDDPQEPGDPARPPHDVVNDILSLPRLPFPVLNSFATTPVFLPDGTLLATQGYHSGSGIYLRLSRLDGIRSDLSLDQAHNLLVNEILVDFPFADDASQAHTIGLLLLPFLRPLIAGATPLHLLDAPARGTGKGLLADVISVVSTGVPAHVMSLPRDDDELEKRITAALLAGRQLIQLDNVRRLESPPLEAVLTTTLWEGRRLGKSEMVRAPNNATWLATGNNVQLSDEMNRRTVLIRLDAGVEAPEERTGFRHRLPDWAIEHRVELVSSCLSVVSRWVDAGMPRSQAILGRFEDWAAVIGGVLGVLGVSGFLANREVQRAQDPESQEWAFLCRSWWEQFETLPITAKDLLEIAKQQNLLLEYWGGRRELASQQRIGAALNRRRDRVFSGFRIRSASTGDTGGNAYRLEKIAVGNKTPKTPETPLAQAEEADSIDELYDVASQNSGTQGSFREGLTRNSTLTTDTNPGVLGVSGVFSGGHSEEDRDVMVVD